jgi:hypothetical protein
MLNLKESVWMRESLLRFLLELEVISTDVDGWPSLSHLFRIFVEIQATSSIRRLRTCHVMVTSLSKDRLFPFCSLFQSDMNRTKLFKALQRDVIWNYVEQGPIWRQIRLRPVARWNCRFESIRWHGSLSVVTGVCCQLEVYEMGSSLIQRSPIDCGVSLCVI